MFVCFFLTYLAVNERRGSLRAVVCNLIIGNEIEKFSCKVWERNNHEMNWANDQKRVTNTNTHKIITIETNKRKETNNRNKRKERFEMDQKANVFSLIELFEKL